MAIFHSPPANPDLRKSDLICKPRRRWAYWIPIAIAIAVTCGLANHSRANPRPYPTIDAARFTVSVEGQGPDIILIPGLGCSEAVWEDTVVAFIAH